MGGGRGAVLLLLAAVAGGCRTPEAARAGMSAQPGDTPVREPALVVAADGGPVVAWSEPETSAPAAARLLHVWRWEAGCFRALPPVPGLTGAEGVALVQLAAGPQGDVVLGWRETDGRTVRLHVWRHAAGGWRRVGDGPAAEGPGLATGWGLALALARDGAPLVAFTAPDGATTAVRVRRLEGAAWRDVGGAVASGPEWSPGAVALGVDGQGRALVAWGGLRGARRAVAVARWEAGAWRRVGAPAAADADAAHPALAVDAEGVPLLAWEAWRELRGTVRVARLEDDAWRPLGEALDGVPGNTDARAPAIAAGRTPYVTWRELSFPHGTRVHVRGWDGTAWRPLGGPHDAGAGSAYAPALAVDGGGAPLVAWREGVERGGARLFVRRWDGAAWQVLDDARAGCAAGP